MNKSIDDTSKRIKNNSSGLRSLNDSPLDRKQNGGPTLKTINDVGLKDPDKFSRSSAESDEDPDEKNRKSMMKR